MPSLPTPRRTVLKGAALVGAAGLGVTACSTESKLGHAQNPVPTVPVPLGSQDAVPVGGAKLYREQRVVVYCPSKGEYKAFSAQCTHAGCLLEKLEGTVGDCPCHGSRFDVTTGKAVHGPATVPLPSVPIRAEGGNLVAGPDAPPGSGPRTPPDVSPAASARASASTSDEPSASARASASTSAPAPAHASPRTSESQAASGR
jgi:nitrite reductase/ring-hydroxylating ferredoxin subunit